MYLLKRPHRTLTENESTKPLLLTELEYPAASRRYIVGLKRSGIVEREDLNIWRRRCTGSGTRAKGVRDVSRMGRGFIQEVALSSTRSKELRRE